MTRVRLVVAALILSCAPRQACAQVQAFVQQVRTLATAAVLPESSRGPAVREAIARLTPALADWDAHIAALEEQLAASGTDAGATASFNRHVELGVAYRVRGRMADALKQFDAAATLRPGTSDLELLRALTLESDGRAAGAADAFRTAWVLDRASPVKAYYALQRGGAALASDDRQTALSVVTTAYQALLSTDTHPTFTPFVILDAIPDSLSPTPVIGDARTGQGFALLAAGKYGDAVQALGRVTAATTTAMDDATAHLARAQHAEADNRVGDARREYTASLNGALAGRSAIYVAIGRLAQVEGDVPAAIDALRHAVALNPNDATMRQELASAYATNGQADEALTELVAGLLIDPTNSKLHAAVGQLRLDAGHPDEAIPAFLRALELAPAGYEVRYALATALTRVGRTDEAEKQFALFERTRRELLERRRQGIRDEVGKEKSKP